MSDYVLDYLFVAETINGDIIQQSPDDKPHFGGILGSSFSDLNGKHLKTFVLVGKGHVFGLDLLDGHFEIDEKVVYPPTPVLPGAKLQLIYYRTVQRSITAGTKLEKVLTPKVKYVLGWQYNLGGKNYKYQMDIV